MLRSALIATRPRILLLSRLLRQVGGVGPITALALVLVIENPDRFETSRTVGAYAGLVPAPNRAVRRGREPSGLTAPP